MQTDHWCRYDRELRAAREEAPVAETARDAQSRHGNVRLQYQSQGHFERLAAAFGMMSEWRDGVPRAAYHGVVSASSPLYASRECPEIADVVVHPHAGGMTAQRPGGAACTRQAVPPSLPVSRGLTEDLDKTPSAKIACWPGLTRHRSTTCPSLCFESVYTSQCGSTMRCPQTV